YQAYDWFDRWLLRGEDAPAGVKVVTAQEARRCSSAWDYAAFCQRVGIRSDSSYVLWLSRRKVPNLAWLKWLFGWPAPARAVVVGGGLRRLRREMNRKGVLRASGLNTATIWTWENGPRTSAHIKAILAGEDATKLEGWTRLPEVTRRHMTDIHRAMALDACCGR